MNCKDVDRFLDAYLDGQLDVSLQRELEQHLEGCRSCRSLARESDEFKSFFAANAPAYKAPAGLRTKVLATARREQKRQATLLWRRPWVYATAAATLSLFFALKLLFPDSEEEFSRQAVWSHSRSLGADQLVQVASANSQLVRAWLTARLDFVPPVVGVPAPGYSLAGGRVDAIQNRLVAALVYKHNEDILTLFCWAPGKRHLSNGDYMIKGYRVCTWSNAACNYIIVSKLSDREMDEFVDSFRAHAQPGAGEYSGHSGFR